ncbi:MAG: hypothetical protein KDF58_12860 [Alphaproteobacteria bacterium]|nr:hypothetical protein [Alphaproteobacteria bacterium]HPF46586.1 hypothetical protein [Emcibacteraceae bacterium]
MNFLVKNSIKSIFLFSFVLLMSVLKVDAATLDFTQNPYVGNTGVIGNTTYSISAIGGTLTWGQNQDGNSCIGLACQKDGLGIGDDEITIGNEQLIIDFGSVVRITGFTFLDLFSSAGGVNKERAVVTYNGGAMFFDALISETPGSDSGILTVNGLQIMTNKLVFTAGGTNDNVGMDDFALAAIEVSPVPLPPALIMFGAALGGIGFLGRKKRKAN